MLGVAGIMLYRKRQQITQESSSSPSNGAEMGAVVLENGKEESEEIKRSSNYGLVTALNNDQGDNLPVVYGDSPSLSNGNGNTTVYGMLAADDQSKSQYAGLPLNQPGQSGYADVDEMFTT